MKVEIHGIKGYVESRFSPQLLGGSFILDENYQLNLKKSSIENSRKMFKRVVASKNYDDTVYIKSAEWDDNIDVLGMKHIVYNGKRYNVRDVTLNTQGVYVINTNIAVQRMDKFNRSHYVAIEQWVRWFYPNVETFDELKHMKDAPFGLQAQIDNIEKEIELEEAQKNEEVKEAIDKMTSRDETQDKFWAIINLVVLPIIFSIMLSIWWKVF